MSDRDKELVYFFNEVINNYAGQAILMNGNTIEVVKHIEPNKKD